MIDYESMSDFQVNLKIVEFIHPHDYKVEDGEVLITDWVMECIYGTGEEYEEFNPCKYPEHAWSIIVENKISVLPWKGDLWHSYSLNCKHRHADKNPLRAAMILFLITQEENNNENS